MRRMRRTPMKAPRRSPAAMHTRISGGPPGDWKIEPKPEFGDERGGGGKGGEFVVSDGDGDWEGVGEDMAATERRAGVAEFDVFRSCGRGGGVRTGCLRKRGDWGLCELT